MKKIKALIVMHIVFIILSVIILVLVLIDGIRGNASVSNGLVFFAMILNIIGSVIGLEQNARKYLDESRK